MTIRAYFFGVFLLAALAAGPARAQTTYKAKPAEKAEKSTLGSTDADTGHAMAVELTGWGGGILNVDLAEYFNTARQEVPYRILSPISNGAGGSIFHFGARAVTVNGQRISFTANLESFRWKLISPGVYQYEIVDQDDQPVLRITRTYTLGEGPGGYDLQCSQQFENLTDQPLKIVWEQNANGDIARDAVAYMGDRRAFAAGYFALAYDPQKNRIYTDDTDIPRADVLAGEPFFPNPDLPAQSELAWFAANNRYFTVATHGPAPRKEDAVAADVPQLTPDWTFGVQLLGPAHLNPEQRGVVFTLTTQEFTVPAQGQVNKDLSLFAGPRTSLLFSQQPYRALQFNNLVVYSLGGPCAFCTFQWLAKGLLGFLRLIEAALLDWGIAIIILVLCVRLVLHPLTKKAQINMTKMSKQMAAIQPELEKIKKKYADEPKRLQQEQAKLFREKNINPAGMLGCLPMFLQMPIWIALYAMLYFAIDLRHQPAFYGVFQAISGGSWSFLQDLSSPDRFIAFHDEPRMFKLIFIQFDYSAINILPILMAVMFYFQQKLMAPPPANEQQAQQQKIMRYMMLFFPVLMYGMPSGLTLYILASSVAGMVDSYYVRKHIKREEDAGTLFEPKKPKPGGFMDRIQKMAEAKQAEMMEREKALRGNKGGGGPKKRRKPKR